MQTIASLAKRLGMGAEKAVETLRYMLFDVESIESKISDEACDLLIDVDDDPTVADRIREAKLKERERAEKKAAEAKRKAEAKKKAAAKAKKKADEEAKHAAPAAEAEAPQEAEKAAAPLAEILPPEEPEKAAEAAVPEPSGEAEPHAPAAPRPGRAIAEIMPEAEEETAAEKAKAREKKKKEEKAASIVIGKAIEHDERTVEVLRADGTRLDLPEAETIGVEEAAEEEEEEESGLLAEAQRRQEEEERKRAKAVRPLPQPDPAVVAEVIRRAAERTQKARREPRVAAKPQRVEKPRVERGRRAAPGGAEPHLAPAAPTGKTARKRVKRAERLRAEEAMRRDAVLAVREYESGGIPGTVRRPKRRRVQAAHVADAVETEEREVLEVEDKMTVEQLAEAMEVPVNDLILDLMDHDILAAKNQPLGIDVIRKVAEPRGYDVEVIIPEEEAVFEDEPDNPEDLIPRAPVVTVMGHVDHGKTTLLDAVRSANVAEGEVGGITQHIAAYDVPIRDGRVVFLDTPGHEAFTHMRARGAKATDIVVLVVAADDGVMPQTIEAIDHAKAAEVPIVVAINKCDRPDAQPDRIRQELTQFNLVDEQWGGKTIIKNISAKMGQGVDELMELLLLQAELLELKANPKKRGQGVVIESEISRGLGPVAWLLVQNGTLRVGDVVLAGEWYGRVRTLQNARGEHLEETGPSTPVLVTGFNGVPDAGTSFVAVEDERVARNIAEKRGELNRQRQGPAMKRITLEDFHARMLAGEKQHLNVVLKADVQGSVDVLTGSLAKLGNEEVRVEIVHAGVGGVNESDVLLASASEAVVLGFHVTAGAKVKKLAETEGVDIRTYRVIYEAIEDVRAALEGMLAPETRQVVTGHAEIRRVFRSSAVGNIAGCYMLDGEITRGSQARLTRDNVVIYEGRVNTLRRGKDDARSVTAGLECGIKLENYEDIKEGDVIEAFRSEQVAKALS